MKIYLKNVFTHLQKENNKEIKLFRIFSFCLVYTYFNNYVLKI